MEISFLLERDTLEKIIIIGGGIAGLSCMNELLDLGHSPLLLEEKLIGLPKVCGEFLAPLAFTQLHKWEIGPIQTIKEVCFYINNKQSTIIFPHPAGAFSRTQAELALAKRAYEKRGRIHEQSSIKKIEPPANGSPYIVHLNSGKQLQTNALIIATGKINSSTTPLFFPYQGFKIHVPQVIKPETLLMTHYPGAYFGIVPISPDVSNLTCLVKKNIVEHWGTCKDFFQHLLSINPLLKQIDFSAIEWLEGKAPEFKLQQIPNWSNAFCIGDALASFYPALGYGFAHSVNSAVCAAHFYTYADAPSYNKFMNTEMRWKLKGGKLLHHALMNQSLSKILLSLTQKNPRVTQFFMSKVGYG